jgi:hypothetical protein
MNVLGLPTIVFSIDGDDVSRHIRGIVIVRAPREWTSQSFRSDGPPKKPSGEPINGGGASVGPQWVVIDSDSSTFWFGSRSVYTNGDNVLLLELDATGTPLKIEHTHIDPVVAGGCSRGGADMAEREKSRDLLVSALRRSPVVDEFLKRPPT